MSQNAIAAGMSRSRNTRTAFLRDACVFHGKLMLDGFRDFVLLPVSLGAVLLDCLRRDGPPGQHFYGVMHYARETERWIDLFEAARRAPESEQPRRNIDVPRLDEFIDEIESKLKARQKGGERSGKANAAVERFVATAKQAAQRASAHTD